MWRQDELHVINETTRGAERKAALCALLEQEAQLIASIGQHKNVAAKESKEKNTQRFLDAVSQTHSRTTELCIYYVCVTAHACMFCHSVCLE